MTDDTGSAFGRLPHTTTQLARGTIGLFVGGMIAILTGIMIYLLSAPTWFNAALGVLLFLGLGLAVLAPGWYWIVQPFFRRRDGAPSDDE